MTATYSTPAIRPVAIVYEVPGPHRTYRVTVTRSERAVTYNCSCGLVTLYGDCPHCEAVRAERRQQGRP
jgi:hypothetical protein